MNSSAAMPLQTAPEVPTKRLGGRASERVEGLTPREIEVLALVGEDMNSQHAAEALGLQRRTVEMHLYNAYRVLGASNRREALAEARRRRLIP